MGDVTMVMQLDSMGPRLLSKVVKVVNYAIYRTSVRVAMWGLTSEATTHTMTISMYTRGFS